MSIWDSSKSNKFIRFNKFEFMYEFILMFYLYLSIFIGANEFICILFDCELFTNI